MSLSPAAPQSPCPVCGTLAAQLVSSWDRHGEALRTFACTHCGLYRNDPLPTIAQLQAYHEAEYRQAYKGQREPKAKNVYRSRRLAAQRLQVLAPHFPAGCRVLDAGSGSGEFLLVLREAGFRPQGLETDPAYAAFAQRSYQVDVAAQGLLDADFPAGSFDAITLFHVLEHQPDPVAVLARLGEWLHPGGVLVVEVPNLDSPHQHPAKRFHFAHVLGFTPASLGWAAHRAGFVVVGSSHFSFDRNIQLILKKGQSQAPPLPKPQPRISSWQATLSYYLRLQTYWRFALRMQQFLHEYLHMQELRKNQG